MVSKLIKVLQRISETDMLTTLEEMNAEWFYSISAEAICENVATGAMQSLLKKSKRKISKERILQDEVFIFFLKWQCVLVIGLT